MDRKAKIVATLGPSSSDYQTLKKMILAGLNVARLNFSHGTHEQHHESIQLVRTISEETDLAVAILQDLQGPKIRIGEIPDGAMLIHPGQELRILITNEDEQRKPADLGADFTIPIPNIAGILCSGNRILLDDGNLEMEVVKCRDEWIDVKVVLGGILKSHKGFNLPGTPLDLPGFTERDREDLKFGLKEGVDLVALSFVRTAQDIHAVREAIREFQPDLVSIPLISKIERPEAMVNLSSILHSTDGVMVARGDLGVEMTPADVPIAQKQIITSANSRSKIVITATQMLESMINNPRPTRAEAADVANAIFDGSDAVMLSGETASGKYPVESIQMMDSIIRNAETHYEEWALPARVEDKDTEDDAVALTRAAREIAHDRNVTAIAVFTHTGRTALLMSKARPNVPIIAFTPNPATYSKMSMYWGVSSVLTPFASSVDSMIELVDQELLKSGKIIPGQQVVLISGYPVARMRAPNLALLHTVGG